MGFFDKLKNKKQEKMQNAMNSQDVKGVDLTIPENVKEFVKKQIASSSKQFVNCFQRLRPTPRRL